MNDDELEARLARSLAPPDRVPSEERASTLRARAEGLRAAGRPEPAGFPDGPASPAPRRSWSRSRVLLACAAVASLVAVAGALGSSVGSSGTGDDLLARGTPEFRASIEGEGGVVVDLDGSRAPEGRIVVLESDSLPVLPVGEYYELWFVGDDDAAGRPERVSAGTFHPDYDDGTTLVVLHAAVDPALFPVAEITLEVPDGDPGPSDVVVLRGPLDPVG